jgi:hypothetical protein
MCSFYDINVPATPPKGSSCVRVQSEVPTTQATAPHLLIGNELIIIQQHSLRGMDIPQFHAKKNGLVLLYKFMRREYHDAMLGQGTRVTFSFFTVSQIARKFYESTYITN